VVLLNFLSQNNLTDQVCVRKSHRLTQRLMGASLSSPPKISVPLIWHFQNWKFWQNSALCGYDCYLN